MTNPQPQPNRKPLSEMTHREIFLIIARGDWHKFTMEELEDTMEWLYRCGNACQNEHIRRIIESN
jgi:hypothetical protein